MIYYVSIIEILLALAFVIYFLRYYRFKYKSITIEGIIKELSYTKPFRRTSTELFFGEGKDVLITSSFIYNSSIYNCITKHKDIKYPENKKYNVGNTIKVYIIKDDPTTNTSIGHKSRFLAVIALLIILLFWSVLFVFVSIKNYS